MSLFTVLIQMACGLVQMLSVLNEYPEHFKESLVQNRIKN